MHQYGTIRGARHDSCTVLTERSILKQITMSTQIEPTFRGMGRGFPALAEAATAVTADARDVGCPVVPGLSMCLSRCDDQGVSTSV